MSNTEGIIKQIIAIRERIEKEPYRSHYVCIHAQSEPFESRIKEMVWMHIGEEETMREFLAVEWGMCPVNSWDTISNEVANSYRVAMLNNMIKMVKEGTYRV